MKVTGILSIRNGDGLEYPFPPVVSNLHRMCDDVIVGVDPEFPADRAVLEALRHPNVDVVDSAWNQRNRTGGTEIAIQMDKLVALAKERGSDWVVVMQADELVHDDDFGMLRLFMERHRGVNGFSMKRLYFWKDIGTVRNDWEADLVRIFRPGTYSFMAENTSKDGMFSGQTIPGGEMHLPYRIYHYSRVDAPSVISRRVRNLDSFFHPDEALIPADDLPDYDFTPRTHDNFGVGGFPEEVDGRFSPYTGTHPVGIEEWYRVR